jgi:DNA-binding CsgD family transcriptional regulator
MGGTWLNNTRITNAARLIKGDIIGIGLSRLKFLPTGTITESPLARNRLMETTRPGEAEWLVTGDTAVVWVHDDGRISNFTPTAELWLKTFFDSRESYLPPCLSNWLKIPETSRIPYEMKVGDERLKVHNCCDANGDKMLILSRIKPAFGSESLRRIGLSNAEATLVPWLIRGKRNEEIALIVGVASKTVEKHVASILRKLKVETRTAAAWSIIELTGAHW